MRLPARPLLTLVTAAIALTAALPAAGPALARRKPAAEAPPPPPPPPAPPPPAGPVGLPDRIIQDAAAYDSYMRRAAAISPPFTDPAGVSAALAAARAWGPPSLVRGAVAYGAIAALQSSDFVAALREAGNTPEHRAQMADYILADVNYLAAFKGADQAAGLAAAALGPRTVRQLLAGRATRQSAYDVQKQGWSKTTVNDLAGRLAAAEAAADADMESPADRLAEARQSIAGANPLPITAAPLSRPWPPLVARALQLAAVGALGEARNDNADRLAPLGVDAGAQACLANTKRNFHQCLAVARPNYEDLFCIGQHALIDVAACMGPAFGAALPPEPAPPAPAAKKRKGAAGTRRKHG